MYKYKQFVIFDESTSVPSLVNFLLVLINNYLKL